jgi:hypothetical protein
VQAWLEKQIAGWELVKRPTKGQKLKETRKRETKERQGKGGSM